MHTSHAHPPVSRPPTTVPRSGPGDDPDVVVNTSEDAVDRAELGRLAAGERPARDTPGHGTAGHHPNEPLSAASTGISDSVAASARVAAGSAPSGPAGPPRLLVAAALGATLFLLLVVVWMLLGSNGGDQPASAPAADGAPAALPTSDTQTVTGADGADRVEPVPTIPEIAVPDQVDLAGTVVGGSPVGVPDPVPEPPPPGPGAPDPGPPPPPPPAPDLAAQADYELDPGIVGVSITLQNEGDAPLAYELLNDGDGYSADAPIGEIAPDGLAAIWLDLAVAPDGDGPTPFTRTVEVGSNGGSAEITVSGQVEKPGFLVVEAESVPIVDFRASVGFTNVGGLPLEITDVDAPGLTLSAIPDAIAAGETLTIELALCDGDPLPPGSFSHPHPGNPGLVIHQLTAHVHVTTDVNAEVVTLHATVPHLDRPSCEPVIDVPALDLLPAG